MNVVRTGIPEVLILEPQVFTDQRGFFLESYNRRRFQEATGLDVEFVQDNHSRSLRGVLRGLHYQIRQAQGKLVRVLAGEVFDVAVDIRRSSPTFGQYAAFPLDAESNRMAWIPAGFAHGFLVTSEYADVLYKSTDYYALQHERTIAWDDRDIGVPWPVSATLIISDKDRSGTPLHRAEVYS